VTVAQVLQDFPVTLDQPDGRRYQVAEIQAFSLFLQRFIECVDLCNLLALFSRFLLLRRLERSQHVVSKLGVAFGANHLVFGARDSGKDIADLEGWIPQILIVGQPESRKPVGEQVYRLSAVHHPRIWRKLQTLVEASDDVEPKRMERTDPHRCSRVRVLGRDPVDKLASRLVRKREHKDLVRRHFLDFQKPLHPADECLRLAGARSRLQKIRRAPMLGCELLLLVERFLCPGASIGRYRGQQERVQKLLRDHFELRADTRRDGRSRHPLVDVQSAHHRSRQEKFTAEKVHLDLAPLAAAVIDDAVDTDGRRFRRS
jgi:hypothetical protein